MNKPRILLVDDEPSITATLAIALRKEPWEIVTATGGEAGLKLLQERAASVVISDERMPGMSGADFLTQVAKRWPLTIRMMLTGQATLHDAMKAVNDGGIWRFFLKPTDPSDLKQSIRSALDHHALLVESRRLLEAAKRQAARQADPLVGDLDDADDAIAPARRATGGDALGQVDRDDEGNIVLEPVEALDMSKLLEEMKAFNDSSKPRAGKPTA
ncbi:MAG: response regulator [Planctomycetes bacterium]|nr:response regulator [Planctomycetota bacterium]